MQRARSAIRSTAATLLAATLGTVGLTTQAQASAHLTTRFVRIGSAPVLPADADALGAVPASTPLDAAVALEPRDPAALTAAVAAVSTPGSPSFRRYISPEQFADAYGPTPAAIAAVESQLAADSLAVGQITANHLAIPIEGTASNIESAFSTALERFQVGPRIVFANKSAPAMPSAVASYVQGIVGLDDVAPPEAELVRSHLATHRSLTPHVVTGGPQPCAAATAVGGGSYTADKLASAYNFSGLYGAGDLGSGVTIGIYELEPDAPSDIAAYQSCYGTDTSVSYVSTDGGAGSGSGSGEAALDIEDVIGLAPRANIVVYQAPNSGDGPYLDFSAIAIADAVQVITTSWGACESGQGMSMVDSEATLFQEFAMQGQTMLAAAGDEGSEDCYGPGTRNVALAVDDPASQQDVTGVGGTELTSDTSPATETVWNSGGSAGGGGISTYWAMPPWQSTAAPSLGVINSDSSGTPCSDSSGDCREVPDVSADADPNTGYVVYFNGQWGAIGGTSAAAPLWAAFAALADADSACDGNRLGLINPALYEAAGTSYAGNFYDITSGNNDAKGAQSGLYPATTGYDMASGLGAPDGLPLANLLCGLGTIAVSNPGNQTGTTGGQVALQVNATDSEGLGISYSATGLPKGLSISTSGLISGSPSVAGQFSVTVDASDSQGTTGSASFTWTLTNAVSLSNPGSQSGTTGSPANLTISGSDSGGLALSCSANGLPPGLSISSGGFISGTPNAAGRYFVTVGASDSTHASASQSFTWTIGNLITLANLGTALSGSTASTVNLAIAGADSGGLALSYVATGLPPGLTLSPSGLISGTPTTAGSYAVDVLASDTVQAATSVAFTWTIIAAGLTISASNASMTVGSTPPKIRAHYSQETGGASSSSLTTAPKCTTTATASSPIGRYPARCSGAKGEEVTISYARGTVTVRYPPSGVGWPQPAPIKAGTALSSAQLDAESSRAGTFSYSPAARRVLGVGTYVLTATFTPSRRAGSTKIVVHTSLVVLRVPTILRWASPAPIAAGTRLSSHQLDALASPKHKGTLVYTPRSGTVLSPGRHQLSVTFVSSNPNFANATAQVTILVR